MYPVKLKKISHGVAALIMVFFEIVRNWRQVLRWRIIGNKTQRIVLNLYIFFKPVQVSGN